MSLYFFPSRALWVFGCIGMPECGPVRGSSFGLHGSLTLHDGRQPRSTSCPPPPPKNQNPPDPPGDIARCNHCLQRGHMRRSASQNPTAEPTNVAFVSEKADAARQEPHPRQARVPGPVGGWEMIEKREHVSSTANGSGGDAWKAVRGRRQHDGVARTRWRRTPIQQTDFLRRGRAVETSRFPHGRVL